MTPERAAQSRLILISGEEEILRRRALDTVLTTVGVTKDDFELETFDADSSSPTEWIASVGIAPFIAERRTAVVRHLLRCDLEKLKGVNLSSLPETALLILVADEEGGSDDKVQKAKNARKAWEKAVDAAKGAVLSYTLEPKKAKENLASELDSKGIKLSGKALDLLVDMTGGSLSRALDEAEKLALYGGDLGQIRESDVRNLVVPSREWNVFKLVDSIVNGEVTEALQQLRTLVGAVAKAEDQAFRSILPNIGRQLRLLWQARIFIEAKCAPGEPTREVEALLPDKPNITKEPPYRQAPLMNAAKRLDFKRLRKALQIVSDTDARLKGVLSDSFSAADTLERMVLQLSETLGTKR